MRTWTTALVLLAMLVPAGLSAKGTKLGGGAPIDRPSAWTVFWCPSEMFYTVYFTADGPEITLEFIARNLRAVDPVGSWMASRIDNVVVAKRAGYDPAFITVTAPDHENYFCRPFSGDYTRFDVSLVPAGDLLFNETFASGIPVGWDLTDFAYYDGGTSAPNDVATHDDNTTTPTGGALGLGTSTDPDFASTEILLTGTVAGTEYALSFWWKCNGEIEFTDSGPMGTGNDDLEVNVYGSDTVLPIASTSWGLIKAGVGFPRNEK